MSILNYIYIKVVTILTKCRPLSTYTGYFENVGRLISYKYIITKNIEQFNFHNMATIVHFVLTNFFQFYNLL